MFEVRETAITIEERDLDVVRDTRGSEFPARWLNSSQMSGFEAMVGFQWELKEGK